LYAEAQFKNIRKSCFCFRTQKARRFSAVLRRFMARVPSSPYIAIVYPAAAVAVFV
jgi:hypothetical protein